MSLLARHSNREGIFAWKTEGATPVPDFSATDYGTAPTSPAYGTFIDVPQVTKRNGKVRGYGAGNQKSTHTVQNRREVDISIPTRLSNTTLMAACIQSSTGNLGRVAIWTGASDRNSSGAQELYRHAKCASWTLSANEGSEVIFTPTFYALGWPVELGTKLSPSYTDLIGVAGDPANFTTFTNFSFGTTPFNLREAMTGLTVNYNSQLERRNTRNDLTDAVEISRGAVDLIEGPVVVNGSVNFDARVLAKINAEALDPDYWTELGDVSVTLGGLTFLIKDFTLDVEAQNGGVSSGPLTFSVNFIASDFEID